MTPDFNINPKLEQHFVLATGTFQLDHFGKPTYEVPQAKEEEVGACNYNSGVLVFVDSERNYWVGRPTEEAQKALKNAGFSSSGFLACYVPHSSDHGIWMTKNFDRRYETYTKLTGVIETLLNQGISEQDALVIAAHFEDVNAAQRAEGKTKNLVYKIKTKKGEKKIVKFVQSKEEAEIESLVNYEFSRHPKLFKNVPGSTLSKPIEFELNGSKTYMTVQEDVSDKVDEFIEYLHTKGNRVQVRSYLESWVKFLARVHVFGTQIMDRAQNYKKAQRFDREKDKARISQTTDKETRRLLEDLLSEDLESQSEFIHGDCGHNKLGQYLIDWGNSGRGNPYVDVARLLTDGNIQRDNSSLLSEDDEKHILRTYLCEKRKLVQDPTPVSNKDVETAYVQYKKIEFIMSSAIGAYYQLESGSDSSPGLRTTKLMEQLRRKTPTLLSLNQFYCGERSQAYNLQHSSFN